MPWGFLFGQLVPQKKSPWDLGIFFSTGLSLQCCPSEKLWTWPRSIICPSPPWSASDLITILFFFWGGGRMLCKMGPYINQAIASRVRSHNSRKNGGCKNNLPRKKAISKEFAIPFIMRPVPPILCTPWRIQWENGVYLLTDIHRFTNPCMVDFFILLMAEILHHLGCIEPCK